MCETNSFGPINTSLSLSLSLSNRILFFLYIFATKASMVLSENLLSIFSVFFFLLFCHSVAADAALAAIVQRMQNI